MIRTLHVRLGIVSVAAVALMLTACSQDPSTQPQLDALSGGLPSLLAEGPGAGPVLPADGTEAEYGGFDGEFDVLLTIGTAELTFRFSGNVRAHEFTRIKLRAVSTDGGAVRGTAGVDFGDGTPAQTVDLRRTATLEHQYKKAGTYRIVASLNEDTGYAGKGSFRLAVEEARKYKVDVTWDGSVQPKVPEPFSFNAYRYLAEDATSSAAGCALRGTLIIDFGDGTTETIENFDSCFTTVNHTYAKKGDYVITVQLVLDNGPEHSEDYQVAVRQKETPPPPPGGGVDAIPASSVIIAEPRAANPMVWPATRTISVSAFTSGNQRWSPDPAWPELIIFGGPAQGNLWIIRDVGGRFEASPVDWFLPGQMVQYLTQETMAGHSEFAWPGWQGPQFGETLYFFLSTPGWVGARGSDERTNIVRVTWGQQ